MADCSKCKFDDDQHCIGCENGSNFEHMSNADKIRSMTDKELEEFFEQIVSGNRDVIGINCGNYRCESWNCTECIGKWLQSEAE